MIKNRRHGIEEFTFFINNPEDEKGCSISLWTEMTNGREYPILVNTYGYNLFCSRFKERSDEIRVEPSERFWENASNITPNMSEVEIDWFVRSLPKTLPDHETWALWMIAHFANDKNDEISILLQWANNKESTLFDFE